MRILRTLLVVLAVLAVLLVAVAFVLPRHVHVERSTTIAAPQATVYALVSGFRSFHSWSPWYDRDPGATYRFEGPAWGVGAKMSWSSEKPDVGSGSQEIVEAVPNERVRTRLDFGADGQATGEFRLAAAPGGTLLTWGFDTDLGNNPLARYFGRLFDGMIGPDYEKGLASLMRLAEGLPQADFADLEVELVDAAPILVAYATCASSRDPAEIGAALGVAYARVGKFMAARRLTQTAAPIRITTGWDESGFGFEAAIPIDREPEKPVPAGSPVQIGQTRGGKALRAVHRGAYAGMPATYDKLLAYAAAYGHEIEGSSWDQFVSDPGTIPEAELVTHMYVPLKPESRRGP